MKTVLIAILLVFLTQVQAQTATEPDYLDLMDKVLYMGYTEMRMEVYKKEKMLNYYEMELYRDEDKMRMEFLAPAVEKGRRMLNDDTNLWMYMPRTSKVMKLPLKQGFMGSDASNRDLMRLAFKKDYEIIGRTEKDGGLIFELKAKDLSISYNKVLVYFDTERHLPLRQEMYSLSDKLIKVMEYSYIQSAEGEYYPSECIIKDEMLKDSVTRMYYKNSKRENNKPSLFFTLGSIKQ